MGLLKYCHIAITLDDDGATFDGPLLKHIGCIVGEQMTDVLLVASSSKKMKALAGD